MSPAPPSRRPRPLLLALALAAGCGRPPAAPTPRPAASASPPPSPCEHASALRQRAAQFVGEARYFLAQRSLARADALCPAEANQGWATWLTIWGDLDMDEPASGLVATIRSATDVPEAAREAAIAWQRALEQRPPPSTSPTDADRAITMGRAAEAAFGKGDWAAAAQQFEAAEALSKQSYFALMQGVSLLRAGQPREGHRLVERSLLSPAGHGPVSLETTHSRQGPGTISPSDGSIFLASRHRVSRYDPSSLREVTSYDLDPRVGAVQRIELSLTGKTMAVVGDKSLQMVSIRQDDWFPQEPTARLSQAASEGTFETPTLFRLAGDELVAWTPSEDSPWRTFSSQALLQMAAGPRFAPTDRASLGFNLLMGLPRGDAVAFLASGAGELGRVFPVANGVLSSALLPGQSGFALVQRNGDHSVVDLTTGRPRWTRHAPSGVWALRPLDGRRLLVDSPSTGPAEGAPAQDGHDRRILDVVTGKELATLEPLDPATPPTFRYRLSADGSSVAMLSSAFVSWNTATGKVKSRARNPCSPQATAGLLVDGTALCIDPDDNEGERLIDASTGEKRALRPHLHYRGALLAMSAGAESLVVLDYGSFVHHFRLLDGTWSAYPDKDDRPIATSWSRPPLLSLSPSGDTALWALPRRSGGFRLSAERGGAVAEVELPGSDLAALSAADDRAFVCPRDPGPLLSFALPSLAPITGSDRQPNKDDHRCALSPDARTLACGGTFDEITLRDASNGRTLSTLRAPRAVSPESRSINLSALQPTTFLAFSPDGKVLASANLYEVHLWDVARGTLTAVLPMSEARPEPVLSADGSRLALRTTYATVRLLSAPWGTPLTTDLGLRSLSRPFFVDDRLVTRNEGGLVSVDSDGRLLRSVPLPPPSGEARGNLAHAAKAGLVAVLTEAGVDLVDEVKGERRATIRMLLRGKGWYATTPDGLADWGGDPETLRQVFTCRVGHRVFPLEACEDRVRVPGLLARIARGERPSLDPEALR